MNIRDLQYLLAVAKHRHFGRAADECFVSQPALSMQLQKLEDELDIKLFERTNKSVMITDVGEKIAKRASYILQEVEKIKDIAKSHHNPFVGQLKLGAFPTLAPYFLPQIVPQITKKYPDLKLLLLEEKTDVLISKLREGKIDAAFLAVPLPEKHEDLEYKELFTDEFLVAVYPNHKFAGKKSITRDEIAKENFLLLEEGHCLRDQALDICAVTGSTENKDFRATSLETLRQMVASGVGITLITKMAKKENDGVVYIPFEKDAPARKIALVWRKTSSRKDVFEKITNSLTL